MAHFPTLIDREIINKITKENIATKDPSSKCSWYSFIDFNLKFAKDKDDHLYPEWLN